MRTWQLRTVAIRTWWLRTVALRRVALDRFRAVIVRYRVLFFANIVRRVPFPQIRLQNLLIRQKIQKNASRIFVIRAYDDLAARPRHPLSAVCVFAQPTPPPAGRSAATCIVRAYARTTMNSRVYSTVENVVSQNCSSC